MRALLWMLLFVSVLFNVSTSFVFDGAEQVAYSVVSGVVVFASIAGLWALRGSRRA